MGELPRLIGIVGFMTIRGQRVKKSKQSSLVHTFYTLKRELFAVQDQIYLYIFPLMLKPLWANLEMFLNIEMGLNYLPKFALFKGN